ncbi:MAG: SGNH/GDSL hydrolase family protein [Promethearchaeota archaeon]
MEYKIGDLDGYVFGLPWFGRDDHALTRFPSSAAARLGPDVWERALKPSGGRIRFSAKTSFVGLELDFPPVGTYDHFSRAGQFGIDLYVDGVFYTTLVPQQEGYNLLWAPADGDLQFGGGEHEFELYLPIYAPVELLSLGVDGDISPPAPFSLDGPVVFYGSSITQGGFASRPGMTFPAVVGRLLGVDFVNLGLSGMGKGTIPEAELIAEIDASCFVMDWGINLLSPGEYLLIKERYQPFVQTIRARHPTTPFLFVSTEAVGPEHWNSRAGEMLDVIRGEIRRVYETVVAEGGARAGFLDGTSVLGPTDMDLTADGVHFNDAGFLAYAGAIASRLEELLPLPKGKQ